MSRSLREQLFGVRRKMREYRKVRINTGEGAASAARGSAQGRQVSRPPRARALSIPLHAAAEKALAAK